MTAWFEGRLAGFDLETTGVDVENDRIVTACVVQVGGGRPTAAANWLANPGVDIPAEAARVHGITTARAKAEGAPAAEVVEQLAAAVIQVQRDGLPLVIMNAPFDLTLLDRECRRHGVPSPVDVIGRDGLRVIDPRVLDKKLDPRRRGSRTLTDLCRQYEVRLDGAHASDADAIAACRVVWRIGQCYPRIGRVDVRGLHLLQCGWAADQQESLRAYFARTPGKEERAEGVRTEWPFIPVNAPEAADA